MAFVYDLPTLQLMLQLLIGYMISQLEVWVCIATILLLLVLITFLFLTFDYD